MKADAVFSGGGIKGLAFAGAVKAAEEAGYTQWEDLAGTSAGAITAMATTRTVCAGCSASTSQSSTIAAGHSGSVWSSTTSITASREAKNSRNGSSRCSRTLPEGGPKAA